MYKNESYKSKKLQIKSMKSLVLTYKGKLQRKTMNQTMSQARAWALTLVVKMMMTEKVKKWGLRIRRNSKWVNLNHSIRNLWTRIMSKEKWMIKWSITWINSPLVTWAIWQLFTSRRLRSWKKWIINLKWNQRGVLLSG